MRAGHMSYDWVRKKRQLDQGLFQPKPFYDSTTHLQEGRVQKALRKVFGFFLGFL